MQKKWLLITFVCVLVVLCSAFFLTRLVESTTHDAPTSTSSLPKIEGQLLVGSSTLNLEVADTDEERIQGLSGRDSLPPDHGLLFIFDEPEIAGIWMKDMNFPIDIIWLDENFTVVHMKQQATPESYPEVFRPSTEATYVLEVNSGVVRENGIAVGDTLEVELY